MGVIKTISLWDGVYMKLVNESKTKNRKISQLINHHLQEYYKQKEEVKMIKCEKCGAVYSSKLGMCPQCYKGVQHE